jgi:hypothetical protein
MSRTSFLALLRAAKSEHWRETVFLSAFNVIVSLLPIWGTWLILRLVSRPLTFAAVGGRGELALYAAAFSAPALYMIVRERSIPFPTRPIILLLNIVALLIATIVFAVIVHQEVISGSVGSNSSPIDLRMLWVISTCLMTVSCVLMFFTSLLDAMASDGDIRDVIRAEEGRLETQFDALERKDE